MTIKRSERNRVDEASRMVSRLQAGALAVIGAVIGGLALFIMTAWLLLKGGSQVGLHLQLLGHYFIGYSVTWKGSLVGLFYGSLTGAVVGWSIGRLYNGIVNRRRL